MLRWPVVKWLGSVSYTHLLKMLMEHPQQVFTKDMIYEQLWNEALEGSENAINVHISNLRKKIAAIDNSKSYIKTVWGIGFKMDI